VRLTARDGRPVVEVHTAAAEVGQGGADDTLATGRSFAAGARAAAVAGEPAHTLACLMGGTGALLAGDRGAATEWLEDGARHAGAAAPLVAALCDAELALDALFEGDDAAGWLRAQRARARLGGAAPAGEDLPAALVLAVVALAGVARGHAQEARADADAAATLLAGRDTIPPWFAAQVSVALALALLRLSDVRAAREHLAVARRAASRLPDAPLLARWIAETTASLSALGTALTAAGAVLTPAELRVLHALPSHRTYREIGESFVVSGNTIKSQAHAVYRKLGVASRSAAVRRAIELGLVDDHV
jgi:LuxR family maltose regulon positive regulatory protein